MLHTRIQLDVVNLFSLITEPTRPIFRSEYYRTIDLSVYREDPHNVHAGEVSTGLHLPPPRSDIARSLFHRHPGRLLRPHVGHQERQGHQHRLSSYGKQGIGVVTEGGYDGRLPILDGISRGFCAKPLGDFSRRIGTKFMCVKNSLTTFFIVVFLLENADLSSPPPYSETLATPLKRRDRCLVCLFFSLTKHEIR